MPRIFCFYIYLDRKLPGKNVTCPKCNSPCKLVPSTRESQAIFVCLKGNYNDDFVYYHAYYIGTNVFKEFFYSDLFSLFSQFQEDLTFSI